MAAFPAIDVLSITTNSHETGNPLTWYINTIFRRGRDERRNRRLVHHALGLNRAWHEAVEFGVLHEPVLQELQIACDPVEHLPAFED